MYRIAENAVEHPRAARALEVVFTVAALLADV